MTRLTPAFSTNRVVRQYTEEHYISAANAFRNRAAGQGSLGAQLLKWEAELAKHWSQLRFGAATVERNGHEDWFQVQVSLDDLDPESVTVELYAETRNGHPRVRQPMNRGERLVGSVNGFMYTARVPANGGLNLSELDGW